MKIKIEIKYKEGYKFFYVKWNYLNIRVVPQKSDYNLLEFLAKENQEFDLTLGRDINNHKELYLEKDGQKVRILGKDWTGSEILTQIVEHEYKEE